MNFLIDINLSVQVENCQCCQQERYGLKSLSPHLLHLSYVRQTSCVVGIVSHDFMAGTEELPTQQGRHQ